MLKIQSSFEGRELQVTVPSLILSISGVLLASLFQDRKLNSKNRKKTHTSLPICDRICDDVSVESILFLKM